MFCVFPRISEGTQIGVVGRSSPTSMLAATAPNLKPTPALREEARQAAEPRSLFSLISAKGGQGLLQLGLRERL